MHKLLIVCLFSAIVLSSSNPIILDELPAGYEIGEFAVLPSDRIFKRSLQREVDSSLGERISKRSLRTDFGTPLTGMERISKRSLKPENDFSLTGMERITKREAEEPGRQRRFVFLPSFSKSRQARAADYAADVLDSNDVFKRAKRHVFLPSFSRRTGRSVSENAEDMDTAESVFLPGFAQRG